MAADEDEDWIREQTLTSMMATQKPGEWVQSLINRFDAQVNILRIFRNVTLAESRMLTSILNRDRPKFMNENSSFYLPWE